MATQSELRADLSLQEVTGFLVDGTLSDEVAQYQAYVNLKPGHSFTVNDVDVFANSIDLGAPVTGDEIVKRDIFVSCYPIVANNRPEVLTAEGYMRFPTMSRADIVYHKWDIFKASAVDGIMVRQTGDEFPERELAGFPTLTFFTPHLYITVVYQLRDIESSFVFVNPDFSLYMSYQHGPVDEITSVLGQIKELNEAQLVERNRSGVIKDLIGPSTWGQYFPLWRQGGKKPQLTTQRYYLLNQDVNEGEQAVPLATLQGVYQRAIEAVPWNAPFGQDTLGADDIPDWLKGIVSATLGVVSGPVLQRRIPHRRDDNGDLRVF